MKRDFAGKVALVTGVSRRAGIGAAVAQMLAQAGATIFTTYYRPYDAQMPWGSTAAEAAEIIARLQTLYGAAAGLEADLADPNAPSLIMNEAQRLFRQVDILVNNAAHDEAADIYSLTAASLDQHYAVNIRGTLLLCHEFAKRHDGRPGGRIINLTSGQGITPMPDSLPYVVGKGSVEALTLSLSAALAPKGITVNAVDPGATDTGWMSDELQVELRKRMLYGRVGQPTDAARLICFLASAAGQWITGQIIRSRGGL